MSVHWLTICLLDFCVEYTVAALDCLQCAEAVLNIWHHEQMRLFLTGTLSRFVYLMHKKTDSQRSGNLWSWDVVLVNWTGSLPFCW